LPISGSSTCRHPHAFVRYLFPSRNDCPRPCRCPRTYEIPDRSYGSAGPRCEYCSYVARSSESRRKAYEHVETVRRAESGWHPSARRHGRVGSLNVVLAFLLVLLAVRVWPFPAIRFQHPALNKLQSKASAPDL